jgi:hypothetical protein
VIERLYEEVLEEGAILDWVKDHKGALKQLSKELTMMGLFTGSPLTMGLYVGDFLQKNFPNLPQQAVQKIAQFLANNPQILEVFKG